MPEIAHPLARSVLRGFAERCPACGTGRLFGRYLKVQPTCQDCAHRLSQYRADDGPAYLTIVVIGHLVIAPLLFFPIIWRSNPLYSLPILLTALAVVTLALLPRIKGGWVGMMYALNVSDRDDALHTGDLAD